MSHEVTNNTLCLFVHNPFILYVQVAKKLKPLKVMFPSKLRNVGWLDHTYVDEVKHTILYYKLLFYIV
jgi:hypothetical protein